jgi:hypothetical protein
MFRNIPLRRYGVKPLPRFLPSLLLAVCAAATTAAARAEPAGTPIDHPLFDANHCLTDIQPSREESAVEFHWGCAEKKLITISCVFDHTGYLGLGPRFARPGWHCNHPLPVQEDENGHRISDVAIGDPHGRSVWAACAVADLGDFAARVKPYHGTACYRAMIRIGRAVNRAGRDPDAVGAEILP